MVETHDPPFFQKSVLSGGRSLFEKFKSRDGLKT